MQTAAQRQNAQRENHDEKRGKIQIRNPLTARPIAANERRERGHSEPDTVIGKVGKDCLLTVVDRYSRYLYCTRLAGKKAELVKDALIGMLKDQTVRSLTPDRGKEFAYHKKVSEELKAEFYFPEPHQS